MNTVNCVGVMGKGVELEFKNRWPANFKAYKKYCDAKRLSPGEMLVFDGNELLESEGPRYLVNFPIKAHWHSKSKISYVEEGLDALANEIKKHEIRSIAIPALGCGDGGLGRVAIHQKRGRPKKLMYGKSLVVWNLANEERKMITPDLIPTDLAIGLGDDQSPKDFIAVIQNFTNYVDEIVEAQRDGDEKIRWTVKVREGSATVDMEPVPPVDWTGAGKPRFETR